MYRIPDWSKAPSWANWVAMDADGSWWWHEEKPKRHASGRWHSKFNWELAVQAYTLDDMLQEKPK